MITFLRNLIFKDFVLKLFALVLAVAIWVAISLAIKKETSPFAQLSVTQGELTFFNLPIMVMSSPADVRNVTVSPDQVEVTVQGDAKVIKTLKPKDIRAIVDLTGIEAARDLRKRIEVTTPAGVGPVRIQPEEVQVTLLPKG